MGGGQVFHGAEVVVIGGFLVYSVVRGAAGVFRVVNIAAFLLQNVVDHTVYLACGQHEFVSVDWISIRTP